MNNYSIHKIKNRNIYIYIYIYIYKYSVSIGVINVEQVVGLDKKVNVNS